MKIFILISLFFSALQFVAQDRLFLKNNTVINCKIIALSETTITYRDSIINSPLKLIVKTEVLLVEYKTGEIYTFGAPTLTVQPEEIVETRDQRKQRKMKEWKAREENLSDNILGFHIPDLVLGRLTLSYERLVSNKSIGILVPFSLTYDSFGALAEFSANTGTNSVGTGSATPVKRNRGVNFITGIDVNYYHDLKPELKYFFGPRIRYGTDMVLGGTEGLSFQIQNGIFRSRRQKSVSSLALGFGFVKVTTKSAIFSDPRQVYPWISFTWRLGFRL